MYVVDDDEDGRLKKKLLIPFLGILLLGFVRLNNCFQERIYRIVRRKSENGLVVCQ